MQTWNHSQTVVPVMITEAEVAEEGITTIGDEDEAGITPHEILQNSSVIVATS